MPRILASLAFALLIIACSTSPCGAELAAHWKLDEGIGSSTAASETGDAMQEGVISGAVWTDDDVAPVPSGSVSALVFDPAEGARVTTTFPGFLDRGARSISAWVRPDPDQQEKAAIISWGGDDQGNDRVTLRLNNEPERGVIGAVHFETGTGWKTGVTSVADGDWHHVVAVVNEGRVTTQGTHIYIDGVLESETSAVSELDELVDTDPGSSVVIGASDHATGFGFLGAIDEIRLYDHALTAPEIAALASSGVVSFFANPQAIEPGSTSTLRWEVETPFEALTLSPGGIDVATVTTDGSGEWPVTVDTATIFTLSLQRGERIDIATTRVSVALPPDVRINEIMASNERTIDDEDRDDSDWIELKNFGNAIVDLDGWYLTDLRNNLDNWRFPAVALSPGETLLVFASNKNRRVSGAELHTDFRLSSSGEYLALIKPDGVTIASEFTPTFPALPTDVSYGLAPGGEILRFFVEPTPGEENNEGTAELGPILTELLEDPERPLPGGELPVQVRAQRSQADVAVLKLFYRFGFEDEVELPMTATADDTALYSATIPLNGQEPGAMVRWRVEAEDSRGITSRFPTFQDTRNSPEYHGTVMREEIETSLPVFEWFVESPSRANRTSGTRCSVFYLGQFYDNVFVRLRGGSSAGLSKKSYKFEFNKGHKFRFMEDIGRADEFNLNTTYTDKTYVRQSLGFEVYDKTGTPGCISFPMRVQQNGEFFSVAAFVEQPDPDLLEREGLDPEGALYKMGNTFTSTSGADRKSRKWETGKDDLNSFIRAMRGSDEELTASIFDHVDVPATLNYLAATVLTQNNDSMAKNYYLYRDTNGSGQWFPMPWDLDLTFGRHYMTDDSILGDTIWADEDVVNGGQNRNVRISPSHPMVGIRELPGNRSWNRLIDKLFEDEKFTDLYRRRLRTLLEEILGDPSSPPEERWIDSRIDALASQLGDDAALDLDKWRTFGDRQTLPEAISILKAEYLEVRRPHLFNTHAAENAASYAEERAFSALLPASQANDVTVDFGAIDGSPSSGNQQEEFIELHNPNPTPVDISGWRLSGAVRFEFKPGSVIPADGSAYVTPNIATFLTRTEEPHGGQGHLVLGDYNGQISTRGEILQLLDSNDREVAQVVIEGNPSLAQRYLRISEIHFAPAGGRDFEFVELYNTGPDALDLTGVHFANGIVYTFPKGAVLEPNVWLVLVADLQSFQSRYPDVKAFGEYDGSLDNAGERITLRDTAGENILDFTYNDAWFPQAEAEGKSLEIAAITGEIDRWGIDEGWNTSANSGGSPGENSNNPFPEMTYARWAANVFSDAELLNADISSANADANLDGIPNIVAYAFDLDPKAASRNDGSSALTFAENTPSVSFKQWTNATDITYILESTTDLQQWRPLETSTAPAHEPEKTEASATFGPEPAAFVRIRILTQVRIAE